MDLESNKANFDVHTYQKSFCKTNFIDEFTSEIIDQLDARRKELEGIDQITPLKAEDLEKELFGQARIRKILAYGPSSGKTTALRQFITKHHAEGIVVSKYRISEIESFAFDLLSFCYTDPSFSMYVLHSDLEAKEFDKNPRVLEDYSVVLTTYNKIIEEPPICFLGRNDVISTLGESSIRKFVFIDEYPKVYNEFNLTGDTILHLINLLGISPPNDYRKVLLTADSIFRRNNKETPWQVATLKSLIRKVTKRSLTTEISERILLRFYHRLAIIYKRLNEKFKDSIPSEDAMINAIEDIDYRYTISDLDNPCIAILDATGDLVYRKSDLWDIVVSHQFPISVSRYEIFNMKFSRATTLKSMDEGVKFVKATTELIEKLISIIKSNKKTLIVTWKDYKIESQLPEENDRSKLLKLMTQFTPGVEDLTTYLKSHLEDKGLEDQFYLTHYQSGKTRVTSEFGDADAIVFLGEFFLPNSEIAKRNTAKRVSVAARDYALAELKQSVFRTLVRYSKSREEKSISVYITSDWGNDIIQSLPKVCSFRTKEGEVLTSEHFTLSKLEPELIISTTLASYTIRIDIKRQLAQLIHQYPDFLVSRKLELTLNEIFKVLPRSRKERDKYSKLIEILDNIDFKLVIT